MLKERIDARKGSDPHLLARVPSEIARPAALMPPGLVHGAHKDRKEQTPLGTKNRVIARQGNVTFQAKAMIKYTRESRLLEFLRKVRKDGFRENRLF